MTDEQLYTIVLDARNKYETERAELEMRHLEAFRATCPKKLRAVLTAWHYVELCTPDQVIRMMKQG